MNPFLEKLQQVMHDLNLKPQKLYNADETGLFWKMLPEKTLAHSKENTAPGRKSSKERITISPCSNSDGSHK